MKISLENRDILEVHFPWISHQQDIFDKHIGENKYNIYKHFCDDLDYKYIISIDGWLSSWMRGPNILQSNSVPLMVETLFQPLYFQAWIPYVHFVPVKADLSDLVSQIHWL